MANNPIPTLDDDQTSSLSRRRFIQAGASVAGAIGSSGKAWSASAEPNRAFEYGDPLSEFGYGQVEFRPGPHQAQLEQTHAILMGLDEDGLLRPFRMAAGLPAPGRDLDGWYSAPSWGPATFGQWLSALSRYYAVTEDGPTLEKIKRLIKGYTDCIEPAGKLYKLAGEPPYVYDKFVCGLVDAFRFAHIPEALDALERSTDAALKHLPGTVADELARKDGAGESYTIPENQFIAWQCGAAPRHLGIGRSYLYDSFFHSLAKGDNDLPGRHAYSHVNSLCSAAKAYLVFGDEKYLKAAVNGLAFVEQQSWATGGWGAAGETFLPTPAVDYTDPATGEKKHEPALETLGDCLTRTSTHFETPCGSYAYFKLTRYLLRITKDPHYGDSMERVMYNTVLGALPLNKFGAAFYQSNYHAHAHKAYFDGYGHVMEAEWPCCSGTLPQITADYRISTYFRDKDGVFVNLYIPSTLDWKQDGTEVSLTQSGQYPLADEIAFEVRTPRPKKFAIRLRIPAWTHSPSVRVNGKPISESIRSGAFAAIRREWKSGDRIELQLPRRLGLKTVDDKHPNTVALVYGPLVLFAVSDDTPTITREQLLAARQQGDGSPEWRTELDKGTLRFMPFWAIKDETYFTYLSV